MTWQPIETAPKDGTEVLLTLEGRVYLGHFSDTEHRSHGEVTYRRQYWYFGHYMHVSREEHPMPTHWMAVPAPP